MHCEIEVGPTANANVKKRIQQIIGVFLYYARAVDESMLCSLNKLASQQTNPTKELELDIDRFLQYASSYPSATIIYRPSDMRLFVHSDASYLSETKSRSRGFWQPRRIRFRLDQWWTWIVVSNYPYGCLISGRV